MLFQNLADDLGDICIKLKKYYESAYRDLDSQPQEIESMVKLELQRLNQKLQQIGKDFHQHIAEEINQVINQACNNFEADFRQLQARMISRLDELLNTFSVADAYRRATLSHPRNATAPLLAILVEAFYYLANNLEDILVDSSQKVVTNLFQRLIEKIRKTDYYRQLYHLLGNDGGIEQELKVIEEKVLLALVNAARVECDRFVRESPKFYDEGTFSIYQFRQVLQQSCQSYDCESMVDAEPAIKQLLKLDFEPKVSHTIRKSFRQTINQILKIQMLPMAEQQANSILQQHQQARIYREKTLQKEAEDKIAETRKLFGELKQKIDSYNVAVSGINGCLEAMQLYNCLLPVINFGELEIVDSIAGSNGVIISDGLLDGVAQIST